MFDHFIIVFKNSFIKSLTTRIQESICYRNPRFSKRFSSISATSRFFIAILLLGFVSQESLASNHSDYDGDQYQKSGMIDETDSYSDRFLGDFFHVLNVVEKNFVSSFSEDTILKNAIKKLVFITPPYCQDNLVSIENCPYDPRRCFSDSIMIVSSRCGYDPDKLSMKAMDLLLRDIDPYSSTLDSAMINELRIAASGKFAGVGMVVGFRDGDYVVISPFDGSPAYRTGIRAGDKLLEIDGVALHGLTLFEALKMVRGPSGSEVRFRIKDPVTEKIYDVKLRRTLIRASSVRSKLLNENIGYLRIVNFQKDTRDEVLKAINKMKSLSHGNLRGLILDLRDNPGGLFTEAIKISDLFLKSGTITSLKSRESKLNKKFVATGAAPFGSLPVIALINRGTASASEILAGALQSRGSALIVGTRSFGKASVQDIFPIHPGLALRLTTAHYYTANGSNIEGAGIQPDVLIKNEHEKSREKAPYMEINQIANDRDVKIALEYFLSKKSGNFSKKSLNLF
ncbi:MAG: S41 family peptidase [Deltaproteobacteria bacterium]|nr:S41 family peptidase [Deltaproteobacteria bacterium]